MESRKKSLTFFAAPDCPGEGCASGPLPAEEMHRTMAEVDQHTKGQGNDMYFVSADSENDAENHLRMNGIEGEASVESSSCLEAAKTEQDLNSHSETPIVPEASGGEGPKDTSKPNTLADESVQDHVMEAENSLQTNGIRTNSDGGNHTITLVSLVNGYEKATGAAVVQSDGQNDIWSPATKLKRRLEDTKDLIVCPGVYDGFSARIALSVGFDTMYMV